jgi:hypothetical protein
MQSRRSSTPREPRRPAIRTHVLQVALQGDHRRVRSAEPLLRRCEALGAVPMPFPSAPTRTIRTHVLAPHTPQARHSRRTSRARPRPYRSAPRVRGCRRARRSARVPPAPSSAALAPAAAARSGAGTSAALHRTAGPRVSLQPRARRQTLTLGGRPAARSAAPGLDLRVPAGRRRSRSRQRRGPRRACRRSAAQPPQRSRAPPEAGLDVK